MMREMSEEEYAKYKELMSQLFYQVPADIKQKVFDVVSYINGIKDFDKALDMYDVIRWKMTTTIDWKKFDESAT
jgi:hypothetical protein